MKIFSLIILMFVSVAAAAQDDQFLPNFGDVPIMEGLTEIEDNRMVFDTPEGTVASAVLDGDLSLKATHAFYKESLQALGWSLSGKPKKDSLKFQRGAELLIINLRPVKKGLRVFFQLKPMRKQAKP